MLSPILGNKCIDKCANAQHFLKYIVISFYNQIKTDLLNISLISSLELNIIISMMDR